jgi:hypothetical protein
MSLESSLDMSLTRARYLQAVLACHGNNRPPSAGS